MLDAAEGNKNLTDFLKICDSVKKLAYANADTAADAEKAETGHQQGISLSHINICSTALSPKSLC